MTPGDDPGWGLGAWALVALVMLVVVDEVILQRRDDMAHRVPLGRRAWRVLKRAWDILLGA
jgi:hypothetical protein